MATYDVTELGTELEFDTTNFQTASGMGLLSTTRVVLAWRSGNDKKVQCFSLNRSTGALAAEGSAVTFNADTVAGFGNEISLTVIDSTHFVIFWEGASGDGFCRMFSVNSGTGAITAMDSDKEYDTTNGVSPYSVLMDSTHILNLWSGTSYHGYSQIFSFNTSTGVITAVGSAFDFDASGASYISAEKISATKVLVTYNRSNLGYAIVLSVDTSTWAVTAANSALNFKNNSDAYRENKSIIISNGSPIIAINQYLDDFGGSSTTAGRRLRQLSINTSTWAITTLGNELQVVNNKSAPGDKSIQRIDDTHFIVWFEDASDNGIVRVYSINLSTGAFTQTNTTTFSSATTCLLTTSIDTGEGLYVNAWQGPDADGFMQAFKVTMPTSGPANLKTYNTNSLANIKTINTNPIANVKTLNTNA